MSGNFHKNINHGPMVRKIFGPSQLRTGGPLIHGQKSLEHKKVFTKNVTEFTNRFNFIVLKLLKSSKMSNGDFSLDKSDI